MTKRVPTNDTHAIGDRETRVCWTLYTLMYVLALEAALKHFYIYIPHTNYTLYPSHPVLTPSCIQYPPIHQRYATIGCPIAPHAISRLQVEDTCNVEALHVQYRTYYLGGSAWNAYAPMLEPRPGQFDRRMRCSNFPWRIRSCHSSPFIRILCNTAKYTIHNTQHAQRKIRQCRRLISSHRH